MDHSAKEILALCYEATECPICHLRFKNNKTFASGCLHCYCYQCIQNWVQRRATCPLCRKPIEYLIKNVESNEDYDIEEVVPPSNDNLDQDDFELSGGSDLESQRNASTASLESVSDTSDESCQSSSHVSNASDGESNEDVLSDVSENESNGNVSDRVDYDSESEDWNDGSTESEQDWNDLIESDQDWNDGLTESEREFDREISDHECDSEISDHESDEDISSGLHNYSGNSEDDSNEIAYDASETSVSPVSSSDQDSDLLSSDDRFSDEHSVSDLDSDDHFSSSSDY